MKRSQMTRRAFLNRTGGLAVGGVAAVSGTGVTRPDVSWAQQVTASRRSPLEPDRADYLPIIDRPIIRWPNNARVAFWVAPNIEWHEYTPLTAPTQPDVPRYSYRDYGNRVGFWRMLEVTDKHDIRCCVCLNAGMLDHCPEIRDAMVERNWDYMAHGLYNTRPITPLTIDQERAYWQDVVATVKRHTGKQLKGRLGAGGGNTLNTPDLMAEAGLLYHCDWVMDDQPYPLKVKNGARFIHVPYSFQINDASVPGQGRDAAYYCQMIKDQFDVLYQEGATNGTVMCLVLHPYWIGRPHRARYLDEALAYIKSHDAVWFTTADDIADYYLANCYDQVVTHIDQLKQKGLA